MKSLPLLLTLISLESFAACPDIMGHAQRVVDRANRVQNISELLQQFPFESENLLIGANESASVQKSRGLSDPRILISTECFTATFTLLGKSFELGYKNQFATKAIPLPIESSLGDLNSSASGLILADIKFFPRGDIKFSVTDEGKNIFNVYSPLTKRRDSKNCAACHLDADVTKGPYGIKELTIDGKTVSAMVLPPELVENQKIEDRGICFPTGLKLIQDCMCLGVMDSKCNVFADAPKLTPEACSRLSYVNSLNAKQDTRFCDANTGQAFEEH